MAKVNFGKLKTKETAKKAKTVYPIVDDPDLYDVVDELVETERKVKSLTGTVESAKATVREAVLPKLVRSVQLKGEKSVVVKGSNDETEVMVILTDGFRSNANEKTIGKKYWDRFSQFATINVDTEKLGDNTDTFIERLTELAEELDVLDAISVKELFKPTSISLLVEGLTTDEAVNLDAKYKFPTMVKVR